jgi:hypothetical protein
MDAAAAISLGSYLYAHSRRFSGHPMSFGKRTWVILRDADAPLTAPCEFPLLDVKEYLNRPKRYAPLDADLRCLLEAWLEHSRNHPQYAVPKTRPGYLVRKTLRHSPAAAAFRGQSGQVRRQMKDNIGTKSFTGTRRRTNPETADNAFAAANVNPLSNPLSNPLVDPSQPQPPLPVDPFGPGHPDNPDGTILDPMDPIDPMMPIVVPFTPGDFPAPPDAAPGPSESLEQGRMGQTR